MIDNLVFLSPQYVTIICTSCWKQHQAFKWGSKLVLTTACSHDPRRYFLSHDKYIEYVRRYQAEGGKHIDGWNDEQAELPLFEEVALEIP